MQRSPRRDEHRDHLAVQEAPRRFAVHHQHDRARRADLRRGSARADGRLRRRRPRRSAARTGSRGVPRIVRRACGEIPCVTPLLHVKCGLPTMRAPGMNILLITTDQQRADTLGVEGSPLGATPRLDAFAAQGTRFAAARTQNPLCQPARATILTGTYPSTHGVTCNGIDLPADAEERSVATLLAAGRSPHGVLRQGALRHDVPVLPDRHDRIGRGFGARRPRMERPVLRLRARRAHALRAQPAHRRPDGPVELDLRAATVRAALRAATSSATASSAASNACGSCSPKPPARSGTTPKPGATRCPRRTTRPRGWPIARARGSKQSTIRSSVGELHRSASPDGPARAVVRSLPPADVLEVLPTVHPNEHDDSPPIHKDLANGMRDRAMLEWANPGGATLDARRARHDDGRLLRHGRAARSRDRSRARHPRPARPRRRHARDHHDRSRRVPRRAPDDLQGPVRLRLVAARAVARARAGRSTPATVVPDPVGTIDLAPTMLEAAGLAGPEVDGRPHRSPTCRANTCSPRTTSAS